MHVDSIINGEKVRVLTDFYLKDSLLYKSPVKIKTAGLYEAYMTNKNEFTPISNLLTQSFHFNKAAGKKITLTYPASNRYPGDGSFTLVNAVHNEKGMTRANEFLGFEGTNCEAIVDLGKRDNISSVTIHSLNEINSWIWRPLTMEVFTSEDGVNFTSIGLTDDFERTNTGNGTMTKSFNGINTRYLKIKIENWGVIPEGNPGAGNKTWLFVDEIEVN